MITRRARRWLKWTATITVTVVVAGLMAATWYLANLIENRYLSTGITVPEQGIEVLSVGPTSVRLAATGESTLPGTWGIAWDGGYAEVGEILVATEASVDRTATVVAGSLRPGTMVGWDPAAFPGDPADRGLEFTEVEIEGPLGGNPAWVTPGTDDTWVIFVHGEEAGRREALRLLPSVAATGYPTLTITYRNDEGAEPSDAGHHALGSDEWEDLEAAVEYALASGARDVVLVGYGVGGSITSTFLLRSAWAGRVAGMVLDSPLLDLSAAVDDDAADLGVPGFLSGLGKAMAALRFGIDWGDLDHISHAAEFDTPILLVHGTADEVFPVRSSDDLAAARPDLVEYLRLEGIGHLRAWNDDPAAYEAAVTMFLDEVAGGPSPLDVVVDDRPTEPDDGLRQ